MKKFAQLLLILLLSTSCETEEKKLNKAKKVVETFISNISFDNYDTMYQLYPNFQNVATYWKINNFDITSATIDEQDNVTIIGKAGNRDLLFNLKRKSNDFKITNSKGLSSDFGSNVYQYCKRIGCIGSSAFDSEISSICNRRKPEFNQLVLEIKDRIERETVLENHTVSKNYGLVSGDVTIKNYSRFSIPGSTYNLYVNYFDRKEELVFTSKELLNFDAIPYNQSKTINVFESSSKSFRKIGIDLKIISTSFIEDIISNNAEGNNCNYSKNL